MNDDSHRDGRIRIEGSQTHQASSGERTHDPPPAPAAAGDEDGTPRGRNIDEREASRGSSPVRDLPLRVSVPTKTEDGGSASMAGSRRGGYDAFQNYSNDQVRMARLLGLGVGVEDGGAAAREGGHARRHGHGDARMIREEGADANDAEQANDNEINANRAANDGVGGRYNANDDDEDRDGGNQGDANGDEVMEEANDIPRRRTRLSWEVHGNALYDRWFR